MTSLEVLSPRTTSSSRITLAGEKKCMPMTASGRVVADGDLVDVEIGGVGGQHRALLDDLVELGEHVLLDVHALEHRLDHHVAIGQVLELERAGDQRHALFDIVHRDAALLGRVLVILADDREAAVERLLLHLDDGHRNAGIGEVHRDAAAHGAGADHAHLLDRGWSGCRPERRAASRPAARRRRHNAAPPIAGRSSVP